jgi:hypothetical protein
VIEKEKETGTKKAREISMVDNDDKEFRTEEATGEAYSNPRLPDAPAPTGKALAPVVMSIESIWVYDKEGKRHEALSTAWSAELHFYRGKKISITITIPEEHVTEFPRRCILLDFHYIMAMKLPTLDEPTIQWDLCLAPDFVHARGRTGRAKHEAAEDFSKNSIMTNGRRWEMKLSKLKPEQLREMLCVCPRMEELLVKVKFPEKCAFFESGAEVYANNKKESCPAFGQLPVITRPLDVKKHLAEISSMSKSDMHFTCYRCAYTFNMAQVFGGLNHW